jgi:hypothetical protein
MHHRQARSPVLTMSPVVTTLMPDPRPGTEPMEPTAPSAARGTDRQCTATNRAGERCGRWAIRGGTVCANHGGKTPAVQAAATRRLAEREAAATLADVEVVPIGNPLEALAEVAEEARAFMGYAAAKVAELDRLDDVSPSTHMEYLRPMVALYERATERTAKLLADWVRLGFDERMVAMHERQADLVERFVLAVVADLDLTEDQEARVADATVRHLHVLTGGQAAA